MKTTIKQWVVAGVLLTLLPLAGWAQEHPEREKREQRREKNIPAKSESPEKMIEVIVGTWAPVDGGRDSDRMTTGGDPVEGRTLVFNRENQYVVRDGEQQLDSGSWRMNEAHSVIYMESAHGDAPRPYHVRIADDELTLQPAPSAAATGDRKRHVYRRQN